MSRMKSSITRCNLNRFHLLGAILFFCALVSSSPLWAETWKPLCPIGSTCTAPYHGFSNGHIPVWDATGPLVTDQGFWLSHIPVRYPAPCWYCEGYRHSFLWSDIGLEDLGDTMSYVSDLNSVQLADGKILMFWLYGMYSWYDLEEGIERLNWSGSSVVGLNNAEITLPPVVVGDAVYVGIRHGGGQTVHVSFDKGVSWTTHSANIRIGEYRFNLVANPEQDALWAISSEFLERPGSLWESVDHGDNWTQVDDGSFPANTMRVVHDLSNTSTSYALTDHGLFVSRNRGVSWQITSLTEPVNGLVFVSQGDSLPAAMVAGTDSGIALSLDEGETWSDMNKGLMAGGYTVTYAHGQLLATGDGGYFTCNGLDCVGPAQVFGPEDGEGLIEVVEYYNTILEHYFITGSAGEKTIIEQGGAGAGWQRTGESFMAWNVNSLPDDADWTARNTWRAETTNVCRFYGSQVLGPNSHFYSDTALECRMLQDLQEATPDDQSRWNFEGWGMSVIPRAASDSQPCPENASPVYRAYNNGFALGKDSNHRYMTDPALVATMQEQGWIDEGVAFCSPTE
jgi:hypothetical protein